MALKRSKSLQKIDIFDTTLRDGEQSPGVNLGLKEKLEIAHQLSRLGVDIIEAGFPITSPGDAASVKAIAREVRGSTICALARAVEKDMSVALDALRPAKRKRLHVFLATSAIHRKYKLHKAKNEIERLSVWAVKYARKRIDEVEFSPEDASRTERDFLYRVIEKVIAAGAKVVNIPDTVGYTTPYEFKDLIESIFNHVPNINKAKISVHCHDDLGLSVANSLSAILGGARQVECTINGIGERAGNASMEEIVMSLDTRKDMFGCTTGIHKPLICETSRMVSKLTGMEVQPNKAIVGRNAFRHESGIHQHGVMSKRQTYEIMTPKSVGFGGPNLVLGKHSGRHAFRQHIERLGYKLNGKRLDLSFQKFKDLADKKHDVFDDDIRAILDQGDQETEQAYSLEYLKIVSESGHQPLARVKIRHKGRFLSATCTGDGPVDAAYRVLDKLLRMKLKLLDYSIKSITVGKDAQGEVTVLVKSPQGLESRGRGTSTDVIEASVKAYLDAVNKIHSRQKKQALPHI
jgi:2-isopropylmalate synthase